MKKILLSTLFVPLAALSFNDDIPDQETANWFGDTGDYSVLATCLNYSKGESLTMFEAMSDELAEIDDSYSANRGILLSRNLLKYGDESSEGYDSGAVVRTRKMCQEIGRVLHDFEWQTELPQHFSGKTNILLALYYKGQQDNLNEISDFIDHRSRSGRNASKWGHDVCFKYEKREGRHAKLACLHELVLNYDRQLRWKFNRM